MTALEPNKPRSQRARPEWIAQCALFEKLREFAPRYPELGWAHASLNGVPLTDKAAVDAKAAGMVSGVWDVFLPVTRRAPPPVGPDGKPTGKPGRITVAGLYIEMKAEKGRLSPEQERFRKHARPHGYSFRVAHNWIDALAWICQYLCIDDPDINQVLHVNRKRNVTYATPDPLADPPDEAALR